MYMLGDKSLGFCYSPPKLTWNLLNLSCKKSLYASRGVGSDGLSSRPTTSSLVAWHELNEEFFPKTGGHL